MDGGSQFERILDATLAAGLRMPPFPPVVDSRPDPGLWFAMAGGAAAFRSPATHAPSRALRGAQAVADERRLSMGSGQTETRGPHPAPPQVPPAVRRTRVLLPAERDALSWLRQCGEAGLPDDFTPDELKRAYRRLARRYHPDRHAGAGPSARATLEVTFRRVHEAYRLLGPAPTRPS